MYNASATFQNLIKADERMFTYSGSIVTTGGDTYDFDGDDIRSGKITRSISGSEKLEIGTVYSNEFDCELKLDVSRYELYGATITLNIKIEGASDVIPMGLYTISEINQTMDRLNIKAYDNMTKFDDVNFSIAANNAVQFPYDWLASMCEACGVTLGISSAFVQTFPNGSRKTGFADVVTDVKTWRDVLRYLGAYLGAYAYIGRDGQLYLGRYSGGSADTIPSNFRYSSGLSDFRTTYDGLYAIHKDSGTQEYVSNSNTNGVVLDLGINPFLQFTESENRQAALQEIIDAWNGVYYVPFKSSMPFNPLYDPGDVLTFTENQADQYDYGAVTELSCSIGGQMAVTCSGDNPRLAEAQDRFSKTVEGLSSEYSTGQEIGTKNFWLLHTDTIANNNIGSTKTLVAQIGWEQKTDVQRMGFMFSCDGDLSVTAAVKVEITVDDEPDYSFEVTESKSMNGKRTYTATSGDRIIGKGSHVAKVYMTVTDNKLKWSDLA